MQVVPLTLNVAGGVWGPDLLAVKPMVTEAPGAVRAFQSRFFAVTVRFCWVQVADQPLPRRSAPVKSKVSAQFSQAVGLVLVMVRLAVRPVAQVFAV